MMLKQKELNKASEDEEKANVGLSYQGDENANEMIENEKDAVQASEINTEASMKPSTVGSILGDSLKEQPLAILPQVSLSEEITSIPLEEESNSKKLMNSEQSSPSQMPSIATKSTSMEQRVTATFTKDSYSKQPEDKAIPPVDENMKKTTKPKELAPASETMLESQTVASVSGRIKEQLLDTPKELENKPKSPPATPKLIAAKRVKIHFIPVGSAPQMKKRRFQISGKEQFSTLQGKLRKMLQLTSSQLFLYINESFVPSPDDLIGDLGDLFSSRGAKGELELKVNYSLQEAWG